MIYLADVNFWLALAFEKHVHHTAAKKWFDQLPNAACAFCRTTQQSFLRLANNPKAFGAEAVSLTVAWQLYDALLGDPRVFFSEEPLQVESFWREYTQGETFSPKLWHDAFLAAFARAATYGVVTFDRDFRAYLDLTVEIL